MYFWWRAADLGGFCLVAERFWCYHWCCRLLLLSGRARELQHNTVALAPLVPLWRYRDLKVLDRDRPDPVATTSKVWHRNRFCARHLAEIVILNQCICAPVNYSCFLFCCYSLEFIERLTSCCRSETCVTHLINLVLN